MVFGACILPTYSNSNEGDSTASGGTSGSPNGVGGDNNNPNSNGGDSTASGGTSGSPDGVGGDNNNPAESCSSCTYDDFQVGAIVDSSIGESPKDLVAAQAVADSAASASALLDTITDACRNIAQDLAASDYEQLDAAQIADKRDRARAWCELAINRIAAFRSSGSVTIHHAAPACSTSFASALECLAKCPGAEACDVRLEPTCEGGAMEIACDYICVATGGGNVGCKGECRGECLPEFPGQLLT